MTDWRFSKNLNKNIVDAMLGFQQNTKDEHHYSVALGIFYLLFSIYKSTNEPNWKEGLLSDVKTIINGLDE